MIRFHCFIAGLLCCLPLLAVAAADDEGNPSPLHHLQMMSDKLDLNASQKTELASILQQQHQKILAIHEETHHRIRDLLTPQQAAEWDAMKKAHEERRKQRQSQSGESAQPTAH
jgi:periplasmic protein CpxP/Spy